MVLSTPVIVIMHIFYTKQYVTTNIQKNIFILQIITKIRLSGNKLGSENQKNRRI